MRGAHAGLEVLQSDCNRKPGVETLFNFTRLPRPDRGERGTSIRILTEQSEVE